MLQIKEEFHFKQKFGGIFHMPNLKSQNEFKSFLGMVNYYNKLTSGLVFECANVNNLPYT